MKKYTLLFLLPILFWGCEKTYDSIINPKQSNSIKITGIAPIDSTNYDRDSILIFAVSFNSSEEIKSVYFNIIFPTGVQINSSPILMYDDGNTVDHGDFARNDNTFSNKFNMKYNYFDGVYIIQYYVVDVYDNTYYMSAQNFVFNNGQEKFAPVISNLVAPDTVSLSADTTYFTLHITARDSNGLADIEQVFFNSFIPPDYHPSSANPIIMYDDGDAQKGDETAGDGIYSVIVILTNAPEGSYRWEFQAVDRNGLYSNKITHYVEVIQ